MGELRDLRRGSGLTQQAFAAMLNVPPETRALPRDILPHAKNALREKRRNSELLSIDELAREFGIHQRTLRAAARSGRLVVQFSRRSAFGRPVRRSTRQAVAAFKARYYRRSYSRTAPKVSPPNHTHVSARLRATTATAPAKAEADARPACGDNWRGEQGRRLSVGV
jgi:hypothetical protein